MSWCLFSSWIECLYYEWMDPPTKLAFQRAIDVEPYEYESLLEHFQDQPVVRNGDGRVPWWHHHYQDKDVEGLYWGNICPVSFFHPVLRLDWFFERYDWYAQVQCGCYKNPYFDCCYGDCFDGSTIHPEVTELDVSSHNVSWTAICRCYPNVTSLRTSVSVPTTFPPKVQSLTIDDSCVSPPSQLCPSITHWSIVMGFHIHFALVRVIGPKWTSFLTLQSPCLHHLRINLAQIELPNTLPHLRTLCLVNPTPSQVHSLVHRHHAFPSLHTLRLETPHPPESFPTTPWTTIFLRNDNDDELPSPSRNLS